MATFCFVDEAEAEAGFFRLWDQITTVTVVSVVCFVIYIHIYTWCIHLSLSTAGYCAYLCFLLVVWFCHAQELCVRNAESWARSELAALVQVSVSRCAGMIRTATTTVILLLYTHVFVHPLL